MKNRKPGQVEILIIIISSLCLVIYEFGFCNWNAIVNKIYNFSLFRIVIYLICILLYKKFSKVFVDEAERILESKRKLLIIYLLITTVFTIYEFFTKNNIYQIFLILLIELNGLLFIICVTKDYIKNIILTIITFDFIFSITTTVYHIVDEKRHFISSLNVANGNFNFNDAITDETFNKIEFNTPSIDFAIEYFGINYSENKYKIPEDEEVYSTPTESSPILYIPSAIGINFARLLGGSVADIFIAGRMFNVIFYGILLIIIFKLLQFKKDIFYCSYLLPMVFALGASYSIDAITIGIIGIFIAYVLKIYKENTGVIEFKQFTVLLILFILCLLCKNGAYIGICTLVFILPVIKSIRKDKKILYSLIIILLVAFGLGVYKGNEIITSSEGDPRVDGTSPVKQVEFLRENPTNILVVYYNYLKQSLFNLNWYTGFNLKVFCGSNYSIITYMLFIFILYTSITDSSYTFNKKEKTVMFSTFGIIFFITTLTFYLLVTKAGELSINGYQARYIISIMPLILININSKKISKDYIETNTYNKTALWMGIFTILDLISKIGI